MIGPYCIARGLLCIVMGVYGIVMGQPYLLLLLVDEADVENEQGNITKEIFVLPVAPLESHAGYRLEMEDLDVFLDGGEDDKDGWVCLWVWLHIPIPVHRKRPAPSSSRGATSAAAEAPCGSSHMQLKKDLLLQHHNLVKLLAALDVDVCKEYWVHSAPAVMSHVHQGNKTCTICQKACSSTQDLKVHIRGQHMEDPALQCNQCSYTAGDKYGLDVHKCSHLPLEARHKCDQCTKSYSQKWHLRQHQQEHQGRFGPCPHCRATFAQKSGLTAHVPRCPSQEEGPPEKQHVCEICGRKYSCKGGVNLAHEGQALIISHFVM